MEKVPLIYIKNRKIHTEKEESSISLAEFLERVDRDGEIYVLDIDGIEKDKPNLYLYPKISEHLKIWVDAGPRILGDVVDIVMAGAAKITVRKNLWQDLDIYSIREIAENEIYVNIDLKNHDMSLFYDADGLVIFNDKNQIEEDFKSASFLKNLCTKYKIYAYESNPKNFSYWKNLGISEILVDIGKIKGV